MIRDFRPNAPEVLEFRHRIYAEDLGLPADFVQSYSHAVDSHHHKFAYWYSNEKFLSNGFDRILLFYYEGKAIGMCGGTHFNRGLYRGVQMYYILREARKIPGLNTLHFRENGFFDWQIARAKDLGCRAVFISVDTFDRRHEIMYEAMKNDVVGPGHMSNEERKYTAKDLVYEDDTYDIMNVQQRVMYHPFDKYVDFHELFYAD